ncbi:MAG: hypothetical protein E7227_02180 [Clostridiales bacterium]|nr:hypothetical protein [Clostridiales bacterium]
MKNKKRITLIIVLLIAVLTASFGILYGHKLRNEDMKRAGESGAEQQLGSEENMRDAGTGPESGAGMDDAADKDGKKSSADGGPLATLFFASDYQYEEGFDEPSVTLANILKAAKADGKKIDKVIICGDYTNDDVLHDYQLSPDESIEEIRRVVSEECPGINTGSGNAGGSGKDILFVQGNHDRMTEQITPTGLYEFDDYLIYVLNTEEDFPWKQGKTSGCLDKVRRSSAAMKECFDGLIRKGETRPVFVAGHVPLHFTARTSSRHTTGDNLYSSLVFDVVNDAAKSLDIVYLFGHDHSKGWDCYLGGSSVYLAKGDDILIPVFSEEKVNTDDYSKETLNFTYMNAGYVGYYMNCANSEYVNGGEGYHAADETLTGTVFEIYKGKIVITRYDVDGKHVLGHDGEGDPYKGGIDEGLIPASCYSGHMGSPQTLQVK